MNNTPSWDLFIIIFFVVSIGYGFVLQRDKVIVTLLSMYAGIVVANVFGEPAKMFFQGDKTVFNQIFIKANLSPFVIQVVLFGLTTVGVSMRSGVGGKSSGRSSLSGLELGLYSFLNSALMLTAILSFMDPVAKATFIESSKIARIFAGHSEWWVIAPIIALVATGGLAKKGSSYDY